MSESFVAASQIATTIEALPIESSVKNVIDKILEQNKMIIDQNNRIIEMLSTPQLVVNNQVSK